MIMNSAAAVFGVLASAVIVFTGIFALVRAIWKIAQNLRDNTFATQQLTRELEKTVTSTGVRLDALAARVASLEQRQR